MVWNQWQQPEGGQAPSSYEDMSKAELQAELEARGLPTTGNKDELVARLRESHQ